MPRLILVLMVVYLATFNDAYSQNDFKWAVGPDLLGLVNKNTVPKYSLYARYKVGENGAIRIRPGYYNIGGQQDFFSLKEQKTYSIRVGYERTKELYKKSFYLLYGVEYIYYNDHLFYFDYNNPTNQQSFLVNDYVENGAGAFIGCRYFIIPNLSVSTESTFQVTQTRMVKSRLGIDEYTYKFISSLLVPISNFSLCFHF